MGRLTQQLADATDVAHELTTANARLAAKRGTEPPAAAAAIPPPAPSGAENDVALRARLAAALATARESGDASGSSSTAATADGASSLWSWAFGSSEDAAAADRARVAADPAGVVHRGSNASTDDQSAPIGAPPDPPPLDALLRDLDAWANDGGRRWRDATVEHANKVARDAMRRAEALERERVDENRSNATRDGEFSSERSSRAAEVATQRCIAAEAFAAELAAKLEKAEKRKRELEWQVSMLAPRDDATAPERPKGPGQWLKGAVQGCVAARPGRGRQAPVAMR